MDMKLQRRPIEFNMVTLIALVKNCFTEEFGTCALQHKEIQILCNVNLKKGNRDPEKSN